MTKIAECTDNPDLDGVGVLNFDREFTEVWMGPVVVVRDGGEGGVVEVTVPGNPDGRCILGYMNHPDGRDIDLSDLIRRLDPLPRGQRISLDGARLYVPADVW